MKLTLSLPYTPSEVLSPNWKPFAPGAVWALKKERDQMKGDVWFLARDAMQRFGITEPFDRITIKYTFVFSCNRRRDTDGFITRMKPCQDALVMAGLVTDDTHDKVRLASPEFVIEKGRNETLIEIEGDEGGTVNG